MVDKKEDILNYYLGRLYAADNLLEGKFQDIMAIFKKAVATGNKLERDIKDRIPRLESVKDRCFISKKHLSYLKSVIESK